MDMHECPQCGELVESHEAYSGDLLVNVYYCPTDGTFSEII